MNDILRANLIVISKGEIDLLAELVNCLRDSYSNAYDEPPDDARLCTMIRIDWSRPLQGDPACILHRVTFTPELVEGIETENNGRIIDYFCKEIRESVSDEEPCIVHMIRFADSAQLRENLKLYYEIYDIEMHLREVISYIFLDKTPNKPYGLLDGNAVKVANVKELTVERLKAHDENQLFHILFDEYDDLNQNPVTNIKDILPLIREYEDYAQFREAVMESPIRCESHATFLISLKEIVPSIEEIRNCIAHNRAISSRAKENYEAAKPKLNKAIKDFWGDELTTTNT